MLDNFKHTIASLQSFNFGNELQKVVEENADKIPDLVAQQLAMGKDGNNENVTLFGDPNYQPSTIFQKKNYGVGLGAITNRITNYMTGAFYESMKTKVDGDVFETDSDVSYFDEIIKRSGDQIMDVNEENRKEFAESIVMPAIKESLLSKTGLVIS